MSPSAVLSFGLFCFDFPIYSLPRIQVLGIIVFFTFQRICCNINKEISLIILDNISDWTNDWLFIRNWLAHMRPTKYTQYMKSLLWINVCDNGILDYAMKSLPYSQVNIKQLISCEVWLPSLILVLYNIHSFNRWTQIAHFRLRIYYYYEIYSADVNAARIHRMCTCRIDSEWVLSCYLAGWNERMHITPLIQLTD